MLDSGCLRSAGHMQVCKYDIEKSIQREMSGDLKDGMMAIGMFGGSACSYCCQLATTQPYDCIVCVWGGGGG